MSPVRHFLVGWVVANAGGLEPRERAVVAVAGVAPDLDGVGFLAEVLTRESRRPLWWNQDYRYGLARTVVFGAVTAVAGFLVGRRRWRTMILALVSFHLYLLGDVAGSRGPDGSQWPIAHVWPLSGAWQWTWQGQWELAWRRGYSPLGMFSGRAGRAFVGSLRRRFPLGSTTRCTARRGA